MEEFTVDTRHGPLAFRRRGAGPAVLLLHGIPGSGRCWDQAAALVSARADVLVPDLLGFGDSARPAELSALRATGQAEALSDALEALGVTEATVVGHDFGGPVALSLTAHRPDLFVGLGLLATNTFRDTPIPIPLSLVTWPVVGRVIAPALFSRASLAMMLRTGTGKGTHLDRAAYLGDSRQVAAIRTLFEGSLRQLDRLYRPVEQALESWSGPTFVAWGDQDPFFSVQQGERTAAAAGASLALYPGAGHYLPDERPRQVAAGVLALLDAAVASPS